MKARISLFGIALLLLCSVFLGSCRQQEQPPQDTAPTETKEEYMSYLNTLPENTYGYDELRALAFETNCISDTLEDSASDVDKALVERDRTVENRYGVDIVYSPVTAKTAVSTMRQSVTSGDNTYNVFLYQAQELMSIATENCLQNLWDIANMDLTQEWWNQSFHQNLELNGKLFCTAGQYSQWYFGAPACMAYNKNLATNYNITDIDDLVDSGEWTMEEMHRICTEQNITIDLDSNGVMNENDMYAIAVYSPVLYGLFAGAGGNFSTLDENGNIQVDISDNLSIQRLDSIINVFNSSTSFYSDLIAEVEEVFINNRSLFFYASLGFMADFLNVNFDYGILPTPKFNSSQEEYISCANPQSNFCLGVPYGLSKEESDFVGLILEAYNYTSSVLVKPEKYDSFMKYRVANDPASSARLDQMFESLYFDMNLVMDFGDTRTLINKTIFNETTNRYVSSVKASQALIESDIEKLIGVTQSPS